MASQFKLSKELVKRIEALASDLEATTQEFRDLYDERSERWQESDAAVEADAWIAGLENLADELGNITEKPDS